ncbi:hypothetical protein EDD37DRAFT_223455 [Exophiala viscosa]|uniref:uncharacterized protein n=1 Tax=Exophiala viscosa TaxID=2486360 RepID=UPI00219A1B27|nr:hypothetical protein EDD37DRAFT_223455 [Exophiala viscosa]
MTFHLLQHHGACFRLASHLFVFAPLPNDITLVAFVPTISLLSHSLRNPPRLFCIPIRLIISSVIMPTILSHRYLTALYGLSLATQALAQDVDECGLTCIANVEGTDCTQSEWPCLCANSMYIERMHDCTVASCNASSQQSTSFPVAAFHRSTQG